MVNRYKLSIFIIFLSLMGTAYCARLLYVDIYLSTSSTFGLEEAGIIRDKSETVRRKLADTLIWDLINTQDKLFWDDSIQTAENAQAVLSLKNGSELKLGESSLVILSQDNNQLSLNLKSGQIFVESKKGDKENQIKINGVSMKSGAGKTLAMQMDDKKGSITATSTDADGTGKQFILNKNGSVEEKEIPRSLVSPGPMAQIMTAEQNLKIQFQWKSAKQQAVNLEISKTKDFSALIKSIPAQAFSKEVELSPGKYYWRVVDESNPSSSTNDIRSFNVVLLKAPELLVPQQHSKMKYKLDLPTIEFKWTEVKDVKSYLLEVANDPEFKNILLESETQETYLKTSRLEDGSLYWRVTAIYSGDNNRSPSSVSDLNIKKSIETPPALISPEKSFIVDLDFYNQKQGIPFKWSSEGPSLHRFVLSKTEDLKNEIVSLETNELETVFKKPLDPGTYYWSVGYKNEEGNWAYNDVWQITVNPLVPLLAPPKFISIKTEFNIANDKNVTAKWEKVEGAKEYRIKILNAEKNQFLSEVSLTDVEFTKDDLGEGRYKWIVNAVDQYGRESKTTERAFRVIESRKLASPEFEMKEVQ